MAWGAWHSAVEMVSLLAQSSIPELTMNVGKCEQKLFESDLWAAKLPCCC